MLNAWHLHEENGDVKDIQARTNNGLERYDRHMNNLFPSPHPSLLVFIETIKKEANDQIFRLENLNAKDELPHMYAKTYIPKLPPVYISINPNALNEDDEAVALEALGILSNGNTTKQKK